MPLAIKDADTPCKLVPPDVMFPAERADPEGMARALKVCRHCPLAVKERCLKWALENFPMDGVWGGTSLKHRKAIMADRKKKAEAAAKAATEAEEATVEVQNLALAA